MLRPPDSDSPIGVGRSCNRQAVFSSGKRHIALRSKLHGDRKIAVSDPAHALYGALYGSCAPQHGFLWIRARPGPPRPETAELQGNKRDSHTAYGDCCHGLCIPRARRTMVGILRSLLTAHAERSRPAAPAREELCQYSRPHLYPAKTNDGRS